MTGDIPPALLLDHICTSLEVSLKEPKQQRWQRAKVYTDGLGRAKVAWPIVSWSVRPPASVYRCGLTDAEGASHTFEYAQSDDGPIYLL